MKVPQERVSAATLEALKFEELAMPLFDQLYNFARWLTQDTAEAEDLVQETYAKALRGFSSFQLGTNFRAWMYRILRNSFLSSRTGLRTALAYDLGNIPQWPRQGLPGMDQEGHQGTAMLRHIPMDEQVLRKWLKVGFVKRNGSPRKAGRRKAELLHRRWQT